MRRFEMRTAKLLALVPKRVHVVSVIVLVVITVYGGLSLFTRRPVVSNIFDRYSYSYITNISPEFREFFDEIFLVSAKQRGIDKNVLVKTITYMLQEKDEYDPELIEFVRSLFIKIHRRKPRQVGDTSQTGQSTYIDTLLNHKQNGFYIEAGAHNGEFVSNSLFFEFNRNWTGLLIEPTPEFFKELRKADRSAYILNACIAKKHPMVAKFRVWSGITGRESEMSKKHKVRLTEESINDNQDKSQTIYVPCFSLNTIMHALGVSHVDYFSLDIEGGEYDVIKSIDYKKLDVTTFSIEYSANYETKELISKHLESNKYAMTRDDKQDFFFKKNAS